MKILAVDDDQIILDLIKDSLELVGLPDVETFDDPVTAFDWLKKEETSYDAILLDIQMPDIDGIELCGAIRQINLHRRTPIVMVTAMGDKRYVNEAFKVGADDYLNKPFDPFEIGIRVERAAELAALRRDLAESAGLDSSSFVDPRFSEIEGTVPYTSLLNYLAQLPRCRAAHSIVTVKIANIDALAKNLDQRAFEMFLEHIVQVLSHQLRDNHHLISYFQHGYFLCVSQCAANVFDGFLRSAVEDVLRRDRIAALRDFWPEVTFGQPVFCRRFNQINVDGAIHEAIAEFGLSVEDLMQTHRLQEKIAACA